MLQNRIYRILQLSVALLISAACTTYASVDDKPTPTLALSILNVKTESISLCENQDIRVSIKNISNGDVSIWKQSNSWGYGMLYFRVTDKDNKKQIIRRKPKSWRKNFPAFLILGKGQSMEYEVNFQDDSWTLERSKCSQYGNKIQVVFESLADEYSKEHHVWTGKVISKTYGLK